MNQLGNVVAGKTPREVFLAAQTARHALFIGFGGRVPCTMEWLLEKLVSHVYDVHIDVRPDNESEMAEVYAAYSWQKRTLKVRESVIRRSNFEDPDAIFTVCHEVGHIHMHSDPQLFRRQLPRHLPARMCDPEWQADLFAMEFLIDREMAIKLGPESAARYFRVPLSQMRIYFAHLRAIGVLGDSQNTSTDHHFAQLTQGVFDFG